jgi:hypothetical protein
MEVGKVKRRKESREIQAELDPEVLKRLPYWVKEILSMLEQLNRKDAKQSRTPSSSSSGDP